MSDSETDRPAPATAADGVAEGPGKDSRKTWREWLADLFPNEPTDHSDLLQILQGARERQLLDGEALAIIHGALAVADMRTRDIMIPRSQVVTVPLDGRVQEFIPTIVESRHSRFPVVGDDMDDVRGILHAKDLLPLLLDGNWDGFDIKDYIRRTTVVPESKRLNHLLQELRETRNHMAVVVDEYGAVAGVVTIEDVLEQIVGDIEDEHDVDDDGAIMRLDDQSYTVKATTLVEDFNAYFKSDFADDDVDTIGGVVVRELGYLPKRQEVVRVGRFQFRVLNADSRRIRLLQVTCDAA